MYDVAIIGGGPAGYLAAERLGHAGKKVLLVEKAHLGGTCLNVGCIPTKTLLNSAKQYAHAKEAAKFGVSVEGVSFDWTRMQAWKGEVTEKLRAGIAAQMKRFKVEVVEGTASLLAAPRGEAGGTVRVEPTVGGASTDYPCRAVLVSTGSSPFAPPIPGARDNPAVVDSTGLLETSSVPARLCVIGGGVIGVEFASLFSALGSTVTVVEMMDEIVPFMDAEQAPLLRRAMKGVEFKLGCKVERIEAAPPAVSVPAASAPAAVVHYTTKAGVAEQVEADLVLMAVGRRPNLAGWGAEAIGLDLAPSGLPKGVAVDERMRTNIPGIWAAGDVTGRSLLAHSAYRMAEVAVADMLASLNGAGEPRGLRDQAPANRMRWHAIPWAVYGIPEAAGVGITEQEAAAKGIAIVKASIPMKFSGRFAAENTFAGAGAVKLIAEKRADGSAGRVLGLHAVGAYSSEFIWGGAALIEQELRVADVKQLIFPHPTVCELIRDAAWELEA